jgi:hypothetical protein
LIPLFEPIVYQRPVAQDWIRALANRIKDADGKAALAAQERSRRSELVQSYGPAFFDAFLTAIEEYGRTLVEVLGKDATAGSFALARQGDSATLIRPAFPYFEAKISLDLSRQTIRLSYVKENPTRGDTPAAEVRQTFRFTARTADMIEAESDSTSQPFRSEKPAELAKHITETLFSI